MEKIKKLIFVFTVNQFVSLWPSVCVQDFDTYDGNIFAECIMKEFIICKQQSVLNTCQESAAHGKEQEKPCCFFLQSLFFYYFVNRQFIGMPVPQGDQAAGEENQGVIGVLWQFSIHSGIGHDCWEMNSSSLCKFDFLLSSQYPQVKLMSKASAKQFFSLNSANVKALYAVKRWAYFESK